MTKYKEGDKFKVLDRKGIKGCHQFVNGEFYTVANVSDIGNLYVVNGANRNLTYIMRSEFDAIEKVEVEVVKKPLVTEGIFNTLTSQDKLNILHYERGITASSLVSYWADSNDPAPKLFPMHVYISNVLEIDFEKFYNDQVNKSKSNEFVKEILDLAMPLNENGYKSAFIGDALRDIVFILTHPDEGEVINNNLMIQIDRKLKHLYNSYMALGSKFELIPNQTIDGEPVYRRVE